MRRKGFLDIDGDPLLTDRYINLIIDRKAREIMHLVASVCLSVCLFVLSRLNRFTYDLDYREVLSKTRQLHVHKKLSVISWHLRPRQRAAVDQRFNLINVTNSTDEG